MSHFSPIIAPLSHRSSQVTLVTSSNLVPERTSESALPPDMMPPVHEFANLQESFAKRNMRVVILKNNDFIKDSSDSITAALQDFKNPHEPVTEIDALLAELQPPTPALANGMDEARVLPTQEESPLAKKSFMGRLNRVIHKIFHRSKSN